MSSGATGFRGPYSDDPDQALDALELDTERVEPYPPTAVVHRAVLGVHWRSDDPLPQDRRSPIPEGRWNNDEQDTVYTSHYPLVAFVERADHLQRSVTLQSSLTWWGDADRTSIVVYSFAPPTTRDEYVWDGRKEPATTWKGLLFPSPPYEPSQSFARSVRDLSGCHRFIAPSRPVLQRYRRLAWNSALYVCSLPGQPCGTQLPDKARLTFVLERSGADFPSADDLTRIL